MVKKGGRYAGDRARVHGVNECARAMEVMFGSKYAGPWFACLAVVIAGGGGTRRTRWPSRWDHARAPVFHSIVCSVFALVERCKALSCCLHTHLFHKLCVFEEMPGNVEQVCERGREKERQSERKTERNDQKKKAQGDEGN